MNWKIQYVSFVAPQNIYFDRSLIQQKPTKHKHKYLYNS